jgi:hypothetical protein
VANVTVNVNVIITVTATHDNGDDSSIIATVVV